MRHAPSLVFALVLSMALPTVGAEEFPVPAGSRKNDAMGGATTLAPGKNYTRSVYETEEGVDSVADFYRRRLVATGTREGEGVTFSTGRGTVKLAPLGKGTRITFLVGPQ